MWQRLAAALETNPNVDNCLGASSFDVHSLDHFLYRTDPWPILNLPSSAFVRPRHAPNRTRVLKSRIKSSRKAADAALADGDAAKVAEAVRALVSATDRAVKRGAVHANYSSRMKSRYASKVAAASA